MICFYFLKLSCVVFNDRVSLKSWNVVLKRLGQEDTTGQGTLQTVNVKQKLRHPGMIKQILELTIYIFFVSIYSKTTNNLKYSIFLELLSIKTPLDWEQ